MVVVLGQLEYTVALKVAPGGGYSHTRPFHTRPFHTRPFRVDLVPYLMYKGK